MSIRKAVIEDAPAMARVHVDSWRTTYKGLLPDEMLEKLSYDERTKLWENNIQNERGFIYVAEKDDGQIIGIASGEKREKSKDANVGDLTTVYLFKEEQGKGIGARLTNQILEELYTLGCTTIYVEVLANNQSRIFYEKMGATLHQEEQITLRGENVDVLIYEWKKET
ncbi:GNAT family N-acetyltransferase [Alkalicoccobacillus gibsonii]|uniref:GNAT family N-acetyltransferase n=1 Tax=Alkalicoccobacillus gibsonii TaxID=79881 RepID=UPI0019323FB6|nr:GNAT family N-acetyltransferase [Alkalicoccobacillus gibsonii]MBM0066917.1 GNAT family N-acetyltransferase [Alkalicoccobacillus gibsonii]